MNMCDFFWQRMENSSNQGDLADIVRASRHASTTDLHLPPSSPSPFPPTTLTPIDEFIDPFSNLRDPLLHEFVGAPLFDGLDPGPTAVGSADMAPGETMKRPLNVFSRMLQISPGSIKPRPIIADGMEGCPVQIPSPRTTPGIKRRKGQAKKVVCIPAPAAASSRPGGEVVPSDLWAWRKYGQKPIKGSPYPRGYYRCSSSKGCSARKQVERSRTDPNMLVITYTSEHNHPWPTQRNALAGSTRSQPSKNLSSTSKASPHNQRPPTSLKEEPKETMNPIMQLIKEEATEIDKGAIDFTGNHEFDQVFHQYKPMIPDSNQPDDFFADLPELEPDPLSLIFSKEFMGGKSDEERENKTLDAFNMFNWPAESSSGDPRKDL